jgi:hypothetical protein
MNYVGRATGRPPRRVPRPIAKRAPLVPRNRHSQGGRHRAGLYLLPVLGRTTMIDTELFALAVIGIDALLLVTIAAVAATFQSIKEATATEPSVPQKGSGSGPLD